MAVENSNQPVAGGKPVLPSGQTESRSPANPAASPASSGTPQYPWQADERFRDKGPEEIWNQYREAEKIRGEYGELKKFRGEVDAAGGWDNVKGWANWGNEEYKRRSTEAQKPAQPSAQAQAASQQTGIPAEYFKEWDVLPGQVQAEKLYQLLASQLGPAVQQYINNTIEQRQATIVQQLQGWQTQNTQMFDIYRMAIDAARKNPDLDVADYIARAAKIATSGPQDVMQLALDQITAPMTRKQEIDAAVAAAQANWELEQKNKSVGQVDTRGRGTYRLPSPPTGNKAEENNTILGQLIQKGIISGQQVV